ncbi:RNA polymerase sigma factor [Novipirellula artificiosorum]|uniref:RNA polymerase sigma factor CnrH n=1 Tax=Novipirellula artificiosorum TaxID=2528016 RepID=A0A5C6D474_9BACT|nr:sigma-70 family RNA polymerase sigma factor [Novipirellula artificiosorum]TWU30875.1 RNA polymerase sigma factor CnrH [Novipirellula artificiosorum]
MVLLIPNDFPRFRGGGVPVQQSSSSTSPTLLDRVREFDAAAWDRLTKLYGPIVYRWCRQAGLQDNDAADVSQEVFRAVAGGIGEFHREKPGGGFRAWLWTITRNKIRDHFRWLSRRPGGIGGSEANERLQNVPDRVIEELDPLGDFDTTGCVAHRALEFVRLEFEERTFQAFVRTTVGGQRSAEVALDLGMSVGAVCTAKWRVLRRLREELDGLI